MQNLLRPRVARASTTAFGRAGSPLPAGPFRVYAWRRVPHMRDAPYLTLYASGRIGARRTWPQVFCDRDARVP